MCTWWYTADPTSGFHRVELIMMANRKELLVSKFCNFATATSFHGFAHAVKGKSVPVFAFWAIAIVTCFAVFVWETYMICFEFATTPHGTHVSTEPLVDLPAIGLCHEFAMKDTKYSAVELAYLLGFLPEVKQVKEVTREDWNALLNNSSFVESVNQIRANFPTYAALVHSLSRDLTADGVSLSVQCDHCTNQANMSFTPYIKPTGVCFKTNPAFLQAPERRGMSVPQLLIRHDLHQFEVEESTNMTFLRIIIESENNDFHSFGDILLSTQSDALILLRQTRFASIYGRGKCIPASELRTDRAGCLRACVNDRHPECGLDCVDYLGEEYEQQLESDTRFCLHFNRTEQQIHCVERVTTECKEQCPRPCNNIVYDMTLIPFLAETKQKSEATLYNNVYGLDEFYKRNIIIRPLHPDTIMVIQEVASQTRHSLLANIGGFFGLFLGGSILTVVHLIYECTCGCFEKEKAMKETESTASTSSALSQFAEETTMHGPQLLATASHLSVKLMWSFVMVACCSVMCWEMYEIAHQFAVTPYLTQVDIEPVEDFPLIGVCPDITIDARKVKQQGLTGEDAALVFGTMPSVVGLDAQSHNDTRLTELRAQFASHGELLRSLSVDYSERVSAVMEYGNVQESLSLTSVIKSGGICIVANIPPGRNYTEAKVTFTTPFGEMFESWKEIRDSNANPQVASTSEVITTKMKLVFGNQVEDFPDYGGAEISQVIDATIAVQVHRKKKIYEPGRCLRAADQRPDGVSCYDHCVYEGRKECGVDCLDEYLGEVFERYVMSETGKNITFCGPRENSIEICVSNASKKCGTECPELCDYTAFEANVLNFPIAKGQAAFRQSFDYYEEIPMFSSMALISSWDAVNDSTTFHFTVKILRPDRSMVMREIPSFTGHTLLANFAGLLGLFLGISILTITHVLYFCTCGLRKGQETAGANDRTKSHSVQFMCETSLHGWGYLAETRDVRLKIFWLFAIGASLAGMTMEIYEIAYQFSSEPYGTTFKDESMVYFPKIAVCPADSINPVATMYNKLTLDELSLLFSTLTDYSGRMLTPQSLEPVLNYTFASQRLMAARELYGSHSSLLRAISADMDSWISLECELCKTNMTGAAFQKTIKSIGICYETNPGEVLNVRERKGEVPEVTVEYTVPSTTKIEMAWCHIFSFQYAFTLYERTDENEWYADHYSLDYWDDYNENIRNEYSDCTDYMSYFYDIAFMDDAWLPHLNDVYDDMVILLGDQIDIYDHYGDIRLSSEFEVTISVRMIKRILIHNCVDSTPELNDDLSIPCVKACRNQYHAKCGLDCVEYLGKRHENTTGTAERYCYSVELASLNATISQCLDHALDECTRACPKPCEYYIYEPTIMLNPVSEVDESGVVAKYYAQPNMKKTTTIKIRPLNPERLLVLQEVPTYTGHSLLSNIGGFFGLFSGGSIISALHALYFWTVGFFERRR